MVERLMSADPQLARLPEVDGASPLYLAVSLGHGDIAELLHSKDQGLSYCGPDGQNVWHAAVLHNNTRMTYMLKEWAKHELIKQGDRPNGSTPLHDSLPLFSESSQLRREQKKKFRRKGGEDKRRLPLPPGRVSLLPFLPHMAPRWALPAGLVLLVLLLAPAVLGDKPLRGGPSGAGAEAQPSSAVFPLYGDVYPHGLYYVAMNIGNPPRPYFLDVDTGSDLTWLQCDAPCVSCNKVPHPLYRPTKNKLVPCVDQLCASLHGGLGGRHKCDSPHQQCDYEIRYADQGSSLGVLVNDSFAVRLANASVVRPSLAFGCGYDQQVGSSGEVSPTDGVLGLGSGSISLLSQFKQHGITKNVVGHCLSLRGGGFLFFGDDLVPYSRATWAPMARSAFRNYYSPGSASLYFGGRSLGVRPMEVVFDSGSSFTYFAAQPYQALVTVLKGDLSRTLKEVSDPSLPLCWKGKKPFKSVLDVKKEFKSLVLSFGNGKKAFMEIPPENYLIVTKYGNACLGILNGSEVGLKDLNILGDVTMQDQMVIYDNERGQIGWIRAPCDRIPKFGSSALL